ncbi:MAG: DUF2993 domain-containing protein [Cyanobacteriota bacterium]|jgi:hypothetical protein|nr:DUF2993 domain-containing protein [Cyanobacteriota bacterium]
MSSTVSHNGPVMQLLASALQLWLRQQCDEIDSLEIRLDGSALALMKGRLAGVHVLARRVSYQSLEIELVDLCSEPIQVQMSQLLRGRGLQLENPFRIRGLVGFTAEGLSRSLAQPQWRVLGDAIGDALLGISPLSELRVEANQLILSALTAGEQGRMELAVDVRAVDGTVEFRSLEAVEDGVAVHRLPMDPNITIEKAALEAGMLQLSGAARVIP